MEIKNIILIAIVILVAAVVGIFVFSGQNSDYKNVTDTLTNITNNTTKVVNDTVNTINNTTQNKNNTYKVYNPQTDSYVTVIGEKFDEEVNRWYTYDSDGVRYYNTRIK
ncbi:hypothetical protein [Methanobrevibacter sp.]|uniref:hypothetical protein n=1 Tax=Methanobrevibacter sp. TaxID=66852 RepID=UPI003870A032